MRDVSRYTKISFKIVESALGMFEPKHCAVSFSGGKDSTLVMYIVNEVCKRLGVEKPLAIIGDPFPIPGVEEFCKRICNEFGFSYVTWKDYMTSECENVCYEKTRDVVKCCLECKVKVLNRILTMNKIKCLFVGIRWDEHPERAEDTYFTVYKKPEHVRVKPILHWSFKKVLHFYRNHPELLNPVYLEGYTSLGCKYCTRPSLDRVFDNPMEYLHYVRVKYERGELQERAGRLIDKERIMERLRSLGYF